MARKGPGPRQPLSQRRPKVTATRKSSLPNAKPAPGPRKAAVPRAPVAKGATAPAKQPKRPTSRGARRPKVTTKPPAPTDVVYDRLLAAYPSAHCELDFQSPFQLVIATILSAQCTDKRVNMVTPHLFATYPTPEALAAAKQKDVEEIIKSTGFFRNKAKSIIGMAGALVDRHNGAVPSTMDDLVHLPGVGRKTANVVLGNAFDINEGVVVDTHVARVAARLGLTTETDPIKIEQQLMHLFPRERWTMLAHLLIWHGRRICEAKKPKCAECVLNDVCPSAFLGLLPSTASR